MSHQAYGPRVAVPRLLRLLDRQGIRATFFVPGYSAERWPEAARSIRDAGHEIGHHGYFHEGSRAADGATEEARLLRGLEALDQVLGVRPTGYRAPMWQASYRLPELLARHGFRYDSGLMDADHPYRLAVGPNPGAPTIIELTAHWALDDWEAYNYLPDITGSGVIALSGRASRAAALERLLERAKAIEGLWIATCDEVARHVEGLDLPPVVHEPPPLPTQSPR